MIPTLFCGRCCRPRSCSRAASLPSELMPLRQSPPMMRAHFHSLRLSNAGLSAHQRNTASTTLMDHVPTHKFRTPCSDFVRCHRAPSSLSQPTPNARTLNVMHRCALVSLRSGAATIGQCSAFACARRYFHREGMGLVC